MGCTKSIFTVSPFLFLPLSATPQYRPAIISASQNLASLLQLKNTPRPIYKTHVLIKFSPSTNPCSTPIRRPLRHLRIRPPHSLPPSLEGRLLVRRRFRPRHDPSPPLVSRRQNVLHQFPLRRHQLLAAIPIRLLLHVSIQKSRYHPHKRLLYSCIPKRQFTGIRPR